MATSNYTPCFKHNGDDWLNDSPLLFQEGPSPLKIIKVNRKPAVHQASTSNHKSTLNALTNCTNSTKIHQQWYISRLNKTKQKLRNVIQVRHVFTGFEFASSKLKPLPPFATACRFVDQSLLCAHAKIIIGYYINVILYVLLIPIK